MPPDPKLATEAIKVEPARQQAPAREIAQLALRVGELQKKRPETALEAAKIELGLHQAQKAVIVAHEFIGRFGESDIVALAPNKA
jgi:hypothetical protein